MAEFIEIDPKKLDFNVFSLLDDDWGLITAGDIGNFNTMTASWGGFGIVWTGPVCTLYVRPQRYTYKFIEENDYFTFAFFPKEYREALSFCGTKSGRDVDKMKETGLVPVAIGDSVGFEQSSLIVYCKKVYADDIKEECFTCKKIAEDHYPAKDYHRMYIGEIEKVLVKK